MFLKNINKTAIIWNEKQITYSSVNNNVNAYFQIIKNLHADRISILSENRPEWIYSFYAGWKNKSTIVPIDHMSTSEEIAYILNDCKPEIIFTSEEKHSVLNEALDSVSYEPTVLIFENTDLDEVPSHADGMPDIELEDTALIIYTSGTTGSPKGVMLSYNNLLTNIYAVTRDNKILCEDDIYLGLLPLHHIFPLLGTMVVPLFVGGTIAFSPSMAGEDIVKTLHAHKVSIIIGVPRLYSAIMKGIKDKINSSAVAKILFKVAEKINSQNFSRKIFKKVHDKFGGNIKYLVSGGAALNEEVAKDFMTLGFEVLQGFGMTEAAPMMTFTRPGHVKIGSSGPALSVNEIKIVDGEILAKGPNVMKGYYNRKEETDDILKDGWLHTGDIGYIDDEGFLFITGRKKEIIILSNGKNINPEEIEDKLASFELVNEAGVFAEDDKLHALISPNMGAARRLGISNLEEAFLWDVIDKYNAKASPYKKVTNYTLITEELPRTRLSKLKRFLLPELAIKGSRTKDAGAEPTIEEYGIIKKFLSVLKEIDIHPNDHIEIDLGLDSLDRITFQVFLKETFGVDFSDEDFVNNPTISKIAEYAAERKTKIIVEEIDWGKILKDRINLHLPKSWITHNIIKNISRIVLKSYFRIKVEGNKKLPAGPFIIAPNHQSFFDGLFVASFLKNASMKKTYFYAKEKHVRTKILKFIANRHNVIVMDMNKDLKLSLQKMAAVLEKGKNIIIFPEGTRTKTGQLGKFKKTFAILSSELNVPVIPVAIDGAFEALPKGSIFPRPFRKININFLDPIFPENHTYESLSSLVHQKVLSKLS